MTAVNFILSLPVPGDNSKALVPQENDLFGTKRIDGDETRQRNNPGVGPSLRNADERSLVDSVSGTRMRGFADSNS